MTDANASPDVLILGADTGVYALARAANEYLGVVPTVASSQELGPIADSDILNFHQVSDPYDEWNLLSFLMEDFVPADPSQKTMLLANNDWYARFIAHNAETLGERFAFTAPTGELIDAVGDKATFARICDDLGVPTPAYDVANFAQGVPKTVVDPSLFPVVAKASNSADWMNLEFEGKQKVYLVDDQQQLDTIMTEAYEGGFRGDLIIQQLVRGDDTTKRSVTAYVNTHGEVTFMSGAAVLLEEHTPSGLGNPGAMITGEDSELMNKAEDFLKGTGYRGFANFDVKIDAETGQAYFLEVNPRIGRNNYYVTASGINPVRHLFQDVYKGRRLELERGKAEVFYSILPTDLVKRYLQDPALVTRVERLVKQGRLVHPLKNPNDRGLKRRLYVALSSLRQRQKFRKYYPVVTDTAF